MSKYISLDWLVEHYFVEDVDYYGPYVREDLLSEDTPTIEVSEDCISREYLKSFEYINKGDFNSVETIREWIDNAPSVVPSRAEGEWEIAHEKYEYIRACSECGWLHDLVHYGDSFCPHCGAKMKGVSDVEDD